MSKYRIFDPIDRCMTSSFQWIQESYLVISLTLLVACDLHGADLQPQERLILLPDAGSTCPVCTEDPNLAAEFFGDGRDGDLIIPPGGAPIILTRDMYWRNIISPPGTSIIDPKGFVIRANGLVSGPSQAAASGPPLLVFRRNPDNFLSIPEGTIGGRIGAGGSGGIGNGFASPFLPDAWPSAFAPGRGGNGGGGGSGTIGGSGTSGAILDSSAGSMDIFSAIRMRLQVGDAALGGGGGGGGGGGDNSFHIGGDGGRGGGSIVLIAYSIDNPNNVLVSSRGSDGRTGFNSLAPTAITGGGGGGGGGDAVVVIYRKPFPIIDVSGGHGGSPSTTGTAGNDGSPGTAIPFSFVL